MADQKITDLTALATPDPADVLAIVDDPAGAPATKKITADALIYGLAALGEVYTNGGVGSQTLTLQNTWYQITQIDSDCACAVNTTPDAANNKIQVDVTGLYTVSWQISFSGTGGRTFEVQPRLDAAQLANATAARKLGVGGDVGSCGAIGTFDAAAVTADVTLWVRCTSHAGADFDVQELQLRIAKVAST